MSVENTFIIYISFFVISFLFMYQSYYYDQIGESIYITRGVSKSSLLMALSFLTLLVLIIFRNGVGTDYPRYQELFYSIHSNSLNGIEIEWLRGSILYWAICKAITLITLNPYIMFGVMGFITLLFFYLGLSKSVNKKEALYLFFCFCIYFQIFNQVRQMAAASIVFYSLNYYKNGETKKFVILTILAMGFHLSAGAVLVLLLVRKVKINFRSLTNYLLIGVIGYSLLSIFIRLFNFIPYVSNYSYLFNSSNVGTNINFIVRIFLLIVCLLFHNRTIARDESSDKLYNAVIICTVLQLFATKFPIIGRVTTFFFVAYIYLIPIVLESIRECLKKDKTNYMIVQATFVLVFFAYFLVYYFSPTGSGAISGNYINYKFI